jgi:hypothetical protein
MAWRQNMETVAFLIQAEDKWDTRILSFILWQWHKLQHSNVYTLWTKVILNGDSC